MSKHKKHLDDEWCFDTETAHYAGAKVLRTPADADTERSGLGSKAKTLLKKLANGKRSGSDISKAPRAKLTFFEKISGVPCNSNLQNVHESRLHASPIKDIGQDPPERYRPFEAPVVSSRGFEDQSQRHRALEAQEPSQHVLEVAHTQVGAMAADVQAEIDKLKQEITGLQHAFMALHREHSDLRNAVCTSKAKALGGAIPVESVVSRVPEKVMSTRQEAGSHHASFWADFFGACLGLEHIEGGSQPQAKFSSVPQASAAMAVRNGAAHAIGDRPRRPMPSPAPPWDLSTSTGTPGSRPDMELTPRSTASTWATSTLYPGSWGSPLQREQPMQVQGDDRIAAGISQCSAPRQQPPTRPTSAAHEQAGDSTACGQQTPPRTPRTPPQTAHQTPPQTVPQTPPQTPPRIPPQMPPQTPPPPMRQGLQAEGGQFGARTASPSPHPVCELTGKQARLERQQGERHLPRPPEATFPHHSADGAGNDPILDVAMDFDALPRRPPSLMDPQIGVACAEQDGAGRPADAVPLSLALERAGPELPFPEVDEDGDRDGYPSSACRAARWEELSPWRAAPFQDGATSSVGTVASASSLPVVPIPGSLARRDGGIVGGAGWKR